MNHTARENGRLFWEKSVMKEKECVGGFRKDTDSIIDPHIMYENCPFTMINVFKMVIYKVLDFMNECESDLIHGPLYYLATYFLDSLPLPFFMPIYTVVHKNAGALTLFVKRNHLKSLH